MVYNIKDGSDPDLVFYYSTASEYVVNTDTELQGSSVLQTRTGPAFADESLKFQIGSFATFQMIYDIEDTDENGLYRRTGDLTFYLPEGNLTYNITNPAKRDEEGTYYSPAGMVTNTIVSGTRNFLGSSGYIVIIHKDDRSRKVLVYFSK